MRRWEPFLKVGVGAEKTDEFDVIEVHDDGGSFSLKFGAAQYSRGRARARWRAEWLGRVKLVKSEGSGPGCWDAGGSRADSCCKRGAHGREGGQVGCGGIFHDGEFALVDGNDVVGVGLGVVAAEFGEFGYITIAMAAFDV